MGKRIKKFEEFVNEDMWNQDMFFPMTTKSSLAMYYKCLNCGIPYISINKELHFCEECKSSKLQEIGEDEFYKILKTKLSPSGWQTILQKKREIETDLVDLTLLNPSTSSRAMIN
jgi:hypothetical protein